MLPLWDLCLYLKHLFRLIVILTSLLLKKPSLLVQIWPCDSQIVTMWHILGARFIKHLYVFFVIKSKDNYLRLLNKRSTKNMKIERNFLKWKYSQRCYSQQVAFLCRFRHLGCMCSPGILLRPENNLLCKNTVYWWLSALISKIGLEYWIKHLFWGNWSQRRPYWRDHLRITVPLQKRK